MASSAISRWLQWLMGRSLSDGFSHVHRHQSADLLGRERRWRSCPHNRSGWRQGLVVAVAPPFGTPDSGAPPCIQQRLLPALAFAGKLGAALVRRPVPENSLHVPNCAIGDHEDAVQMPLV